MTTYELPPEPPIGTRLADKTGDVWMRTLNGLWGIEGFDGSVFWLTLLADIGPLTEVPASSLPTEDGALIIASGKSSGEPFENKLLMQLPGAWYGAVRDGLATPREITSWTEAVAVPKHALDALREAIRVRPDADTDLIPDRAIDLIHAVDGTV